MLANGLNKLLTLVMSNQLSVVCECSFRCDVAAPVVQASDLVVFYTVSTAGVLIMDTQDICAWVGRKTKIKLVNV